MQPPDHFIRVEFASVRNNVFRAVHERLELLVLAAEDDRAFMTCEGKPEQKVRLPATGRAAIIDLVGKGIIRYPLRLVDRLPDRDLLLEILQEPQKLLGFRVVQGGEQFGPFSQ